MFVFNTKIIYFPSPEFSSFPSTILIRTNRVSRIFNEKLLRTGKIGCLDNHWQMFILGCLLSTETVLTVAWVFCSSSQVLMQVIYSKASKDASVICSLSGSHIGFSLWLIYNAGLYVVCIYQAFLVWKVPQNHRESRLICVWHDHTVCYCSCLYLVVLGYLRLVSDSFKLCHFRKGEKRNYVRKSSVKTYLILQNVEYALKLQLASLWPKFMAEN